MFGKRFLSRRRKGPAKAGSLPTEKTLLTVILVGLAVFFVFFISSRSLLRHNSAPIIKNIDTVSKQEQINSGLPVRLKIPEINIDSAVEYVGINSDGAMDAPRSPDDVAWFELGKRPGDSGSAVIAGHYGWKDGKSAAFDNLYKLRKGDQLYIEDGKGITTSFVVRESRRYDPGADASNIFSSNDGKSHLNLITCEGTWDKNMKSYSERLVVFADKE